MDKAAILSMFITFVMSNDVLKFEPANRTVVEVVSGKPPAFCNKLDCPEFSVIKTTKDYEVRKYAKSSWVSTNLQDVDYEMASYTMFMKLFKYIQGANTGKKEIPMTCPVTNRIIPAQGPACESNFTMSFYVAPDQIPAPPATDSTVFLYTAPEFTVYVRQFGGFTNKFVDWQKEAVALSKALKKDGVEDFETEYYFTAGYDAPFKLFNRHNEIWFLKK